MSDRDDKTLTPSIETGTISEYVEWCDRKIAESLAAPQHLLEPSGGFSSTPPAPIPKPVPEQIGDDDE